MTDSEKEMTIPNDPRTGAVTPLAAAMLDTVGGSKSASRTKGVTSALPRFTRSCTLPAGTLTVTFPLPAGVTVAVHVVPRPVFSSWSTAVRSETSPLPTLISLRRSPVTGSLKVSLIGNAAFTGPELLLVMVTVGASRSACTVYVAAFVLPLM